EVRQGEHHPNAVFLIAVRGKLLRLRGDAATGEGLLERAEERQRRGRGAPGRGPTPGAVPPGERAARQHGETPAPPGPGREVPAGGGGGGRAAGIGEGCASSSRGWRARCGWCRPPPRGGWCPPISS